MRENAAEWSVAVDVRCLQDPNYAERGVGRHALALLRGAPHAVTLVGVGDLKLPPVIGTVKPVGSTVKSPVVGST